MIDREPFPVVVVTGPIGVGKTTITQELGHLLSAHDMPNTAIDMDWLRATYPRPADDPFNMELGYRNLADVIRNSRAAGSMRAVVANVVETREQRDAYQRAIPDAKVSVVRLTATIEVIQRRIARRADGDDDPWERERAAELVRIMDANDVADVLIDTSRKAPPAIAREIAAWLGWLPPALSTP